MTCPIFCPTQVFVPEQIERFHYSQQRQREFSAGYTVLSTGCAPKLTSKFFRLSLWDGNFHSSSTAKAPASTDGWMGLYIPGVHGSSNCRYHNITIFEALLDKWED